MNKYDVTIILNPNLEEEALNSEYTAIQELMERFGATVEKVDDWGKRKLAYEIQKLSEGYYRFYAINAEGNVPAEIESRLRLRENVIRYLIIRLDA